MKATLTLLVPLLVSMWVTSLAASPPGRTSWRGDHGAAGARTRHAGRGLSSLLPNMGLDSLHRRGRRSAGARSTENNLPHTAMTFGRGHVITFGGNYFHLASHQDSPCVHVMARDHIHHHFTVLKAGRSVSLLTQHTAVTLHSNNKVEINNTGIHRDLPAESWDRQLAVTRDHATVTVQNAEGIMIQCDISHSQCIYRLPNSHFNQSVGLLGSNDGQADNDFTLRNGEATNDWRDFADSYELSGVHDCRQSATPSTPEQCMSGRHADRCRFLFRTRTSPLQACFATVNVEPFMEACEVESRSCEGDKDGLLCTVASAYVKMCGHRGITHLTLTECGSCQGHALGSEWYEKLDKKLDVVFVISLKRGMVASLPSLMHRLTRTITMLSRKEDGVRHNIRFGLLGFGGAGFLAKPHVYTVQGELFAREHNNAIWRERLQSLRESSDVPYTTEALCEPMEALRVAASYPFRHDAAKVTFLVMDSPSQAVDTPALQSLKSLYKNHGITLNMVTNSLSLGALGFRGGEVDLLPSPMSAGPSSATLPQDSPSQLVHCTKGALFDLTRVVEADSTTTHAIQDQVLRQLTRQTSRCRQCNCSVHVRGPTRVVCHSIRCV